jgi:hypothetical protein
MAQIMASLQGKSVITPAKMTMFSLKNVVALGKVTDLDELEELASELLRDRHSDLNTVLACMTGAFQVQGYEYAEAQSRASTSLMYRIVVQSFDGYNSLLLHLRNLPGASTNFAPAVKPEIDHWLKVFNKVRTKSGGPMCIALRIYGVFRDGMHKGWMSTKRFNQRLQFVEQSLATKVVMPESGVDASEPQPSSGARQAWIPKGSIVAHVCPACGMVHRGERGKIPRDVDCPFHDLPKEERMRVARVVTENPSAIIVDWDKIKKK